MASQAVTLSFGIELETVFCFNEQLLRRHLQKHLPASDIIKSIDDKEPCLRHKSYPQRPYNSWAIKDDSRTHPETTTPNVTDDTRGTFRAYIDEPVNMVKEIIQRNSRHTNLSTHWKHSEKPTDYSSWHICNDPSLAGISKGDMIQKFPHLVPTTEAAQDWDSWGIELVSPPYTDVDVAMNETSEMVNIMTAVSNTDSEYSTTTTDLCAFHIHVGKPDKTRLDTKTLQHLAWLLVVFEDAVKDLHSPHQRQIYAPRPGESMSEIQSMRDYWMLDAPAPVVRTITDPTTKEQHTEDWETWYAPLQTIREDIFGTASEEQGDDQQLKSLVKLMSTNQRGHVVNFASLLKEGRPNTVEFRQHAGTLDLDEIRWWILFCTGLVQAAYRRGREGREYAVEDWEGVVELSIEQLFDELEFPEEGREFYRGKMDLYRSIMDRNGEEGMSMVFEKFEDLALEEDA